MLDVTEEAITPWSSIQRTMDKQNLTNLHCVIHGEHNPAKHIPGSNQIDLMFRCLLVACSTVQAGILPFKFGIDSVHQGLYVNIDVPNIFPCHNGSKITFSQTIKLKK